MRWGVRKFLILMVLGKWNLPSLNWGRSTLILALRDAFAGGFVAGIVEGKSLDESIDMGHWLARLSIKELGPSYVTSISLSDRLELFLQAIKSENGAFIPVDNLISVSSLSISSVIWDNSPPLSA